MKRKSLLITGVFFFLMTGAVLFADETALGLESIVIDSFDGPGSGTFEDNGAPIVWQVFGSKFTAEGYPRLAYAPETWPQNLFGPYPENQVELQAIGVRSRFTREAYNQFELIPGEGEGDAWVAKPIPLPGRVKTIDFWAWGSNYNYTIEFYFLDYRGMEYRLVPNHLDPVLQRAPGSLKFVGWKNMYMDIPSYIRQQVTYQPRLAGLKITKIVIATHPLENVSNNDLYIDHLKVLTDIHETTFDGSGLASEETRALIWGTEE